MCLNADYSERCCEKQFARISNHVSSYLTMILPSAVVGSLSHLPRDGETECFFVAIALEMCTSVAQISLCAYRFFRIAVCARPVVGDFSGAQVNHEKSTPQFHPNDFGFSMLAAQRL